MFNSIIYKLLQVGKRARPETETAVYFLRTMASKPTTEKLNKFKILLQFLNWTVKYCCIIIADNIHNLEAWVDAYYVFCGEMWVYNEGCRPMGWGVFRLRASKKNINTKSLTYTGILGVSKYLPFLVWCVKYMRAQGWII